MSRRPLSSLLVVVLCFGGLAACKTGPQRPPSYDLPTTSEAGQTLDRWFRGELEHGDLELPPPRERSESAQPEEDDDTEERDRVAIERLFASAEIHHWAGDVERAFELYGRMLHRQPDHPLNRYASARLYDLRDSVVDFQRRVKPVLESIAFEGVSPLTRAYLSLTARDVRHHAWRTSDAARPYHADATGWPADWRATPRLSPWRSTDFGRSFQPEQQRRLADKYLSPWFADDRPLNRSRSRPYRAQGINLSPDFDQSGIYYLETFATVEPSEAGSSSARTYWLYGNFAGAAEVWVDGEPVLERSPDGYGTGQRFRRVQLSPGTHRILVKLAFDPGYRDWFDLAWLGDGATPLAQSGLEFHRTPPEEGTERAELTLESPMRRPGQFEPVRLDPERLDDAAPSALYLAALGAYYGQQPDRFDPAWRELMDRHGDFAAGHGLRSAQIQTLWQMPDDKRDAESLKHLRRAHELDRDSLHYLTQLARTLKSRQGAESQEVHDLLEIAERAAVADEEGDGSGRIRNIAPLEAWASLLSDRGWDEEAERAWRRVVETAPSHCRAARRLQSSYYERSHYPPLESITPKWKQCPGLEETLIFDRPDRESAKLAYHRRQAQRYPFSASHQIDWAEQLRALDRDKRALEVLRQARDRMPWSNALWSELAEIRLADDGQQAALDLLQQAIETNGHSEALSTRISTLNNEIPLRELMLDGRDRAMAHLEAGREGSEGAKSSDEAYYVVDYAARQYMDNGTSRTLTHTVVRTMTKGAIDRFGETSIPGNAELLMARTINQDGSIEVPEPRAGKSTLSMPGLDEGDFVELAYLQHSGGSQQSRTHREGIKFFFRMSDISSIHSEYVILGEHDASFIRQNDPPDAESFEKAGYEGVRFLREDSSRPRSEPFSVGGAEFLPWIQLYDRGVTLETFEVDRRYVADRLMNSLESSRKLRRQVDKWRDNTEPGTPEEIRDLYYDVTGWLSSANPTAFGRDATHALLSKEGSPYVLLQMAYRLAGIESDIYLVKSQYEHPDSFPIGEFSKYRRVLMRVKGPDETYWIAPSGRDAMFGAVSLSLTGQPAVCVTCDDLVRKTVPESGFRNASREVSVNAELSEQGELTGTAEVVVHGIRAVNLRSNLRRTPSDTRRRKFMGQLLTGFLPGSTLTDYRLRDVDSRDKPLTMELDFKLGNFAQSTSDGNWRIQAALFREPVASAYGKLSNRVRPMLIGRQRETSYNMTVDLPESLEATLESQSGAWSLDSEYGDFSRSVTLENGQLRVESGLRLPIQRISTDEYDAFRQWAIKVERSSRLLVTLSPS